MTCESDVTIVYSTAAHSMRYMGQSSALQHKQAAACNVIG